MGFAGIFSCIYIGALTRLVPCHTLFSPPLSLISFLFPTSPFYFNILVLNFFVCFVVLFILWSGELKNNLFFLEVERLVLWTQQWETERSKESEKRIPVGARAFPWVHTILSGTAGGKWKRNPPRRTEQSPKETPGETESSEKEWDAQMLNCLKHPTDNTGSLSLRILVQMLSTV